MTAQGIEEQEVWVESPIFGHAYEVSSLGRVRSSKGVKSPYRDKDGYLTVNLHSEGKRRACNVHRLVALAFHADRQNVLHCEVAHLDGDRKNACAANLKWVSKVENHYHRRAHGTHSAGERHPRAKLSNEQVQSIRNARGVYTARDLAKLHSVSRHAIYDIWQGKRWTSTTHESPVAASDAPNKDSLMTNPSNRTDVTDAMIEAGYMQACAYPGVALRASRNETRSMVETVIRSALAVEHQSGEVDYYDAFLDAQLEIVELKKEIKRLSRSAQPVDQEEVREVLRDGIRIFGSVAPRWKCRAATLLEKLGAKQ